MNVFLFIITIFFLQANFLSQHVKTNPLKEIIPSKVNSKGEKLRSSNNNLDVTTFNSKFYLATRNAPSHFASKKAKLIIWKGNNLDSLELSQTIEMRSDLREPRFFSKNDTLFLMFFQAGTKKFKFQPKSAWVMFLNKNTWSKPKQINLPQGYVPWRIKTYNQIHYLSSYEGSKQYNINEPGEIRMFISNNGFDWRGLTKTPQIIHPRAISEGEFVFDSIGNIFGIARLEYDGSYIFYGTKDSLDQFEYRYSEYKFDSPLLFEHNKQFYLLSRRNIDGKFVKKKKHKKNLIRYSMKRKTTSLFRVDFSNHCLIHLLDLGTTGDCAFPAIVKKNKDEYYIIDYSSNIKKKKKNWIRGQLGSTNIYMTTLSFSDNEEKVIAKYCFN